MEPSAALQSAMNRKEDVTKARKPSGQYRKHIRLIIISAVLFALLAVYMHAGATLGFENWVYAKSVAWMSPPLTAVLKGITHLGDTPTVIAFCLVLIAVPKTRRTIALPVSAAVTLSALVNIVLKNLFARERPDILRLISETSYSFPSGHAMVGAALYTMLIIMIFRFVRSRKKRLALSVPCALLVVAIGFSRVYLGVHYAGDILGGWLIGFSLAVLVYALWKKSELYERAHKPHSHS